MTTAIHAPTIAEVARENEQKRGDMLVGLSAMALMLIGAVALFSAIAALSENDRSGGGICLLAAAVSFGFLTTLTR